MTEVPADGADAAEAPRCHACGALRPPAVQWCLQCYARFDLPEDVPGDGPGTDEADEASDGVLGPREPARPGAPAADPDEAAARAEEMLRQLAADGTGSDQGLGAWGGRVQGRGAKVGLAVGGAVVLMLVLFGAMAALGALL